MDQMSTGGGCNSLEELLCTIRVPSISKPTFIEIERLLGLSFDQYLGKLMLQAGCEEKQIAIENDEYRISPGDSSYNCHSRWKVVQKIT